MKTKYTKEILCPVVKESISISEVVRKLTGKQKVHGSMVKYIGDKIRLYNIDMSHFKGMSWCSGKINPTGIAYSKQQFIDKFLKKDGPFIRTSVLKEKLWKFNILKKECLFCKNKGVWNGLKLTLQLDHKDGVNNNELENLRILCPNCHSQTSTYSGKNNRKSNG